MLKKKKKPEKNNDSIVGFNVCPIFRPILRKQSALMMSHPQESKPFFTSINC